MEENRSSGALVVGAGFRITPNAAGYHVIAPTICKGSCRCGKRCERYANHAETHPHCCKPHFSPSVKHGQSWRAGTDWQGYKRILNGLDYN